MLDFLRKKPEMAATSAAAVQTSEVSKFNKIINFCMYALVVLVPVLFLPITAQMRDFNKQALIFFVMVLMLAVWVIKILSTRKVSWTKTSLDYILLGYLAIYLIASLISIDKVSSFLGYYGRFTGSFVSVLSFVILYFLIVNNVRSLVTLHRIAKYYLIGSGIVLIYSLLQLMSVFILPLKATHSNGFNPIGSLVGLAIYAALSVIFMQWMLFTGSNHRLKTVVLWVLTAVAVVILFLINAFTAWLILALGLVAFLAVAMASTASTDSMSMNWYWKPMLLLVISVLFVSFQFLPQSLNPRRLVTVNLPTEIQLSNSTTWSLVGNSLKSGAKTAILGSGPGTTGIAYGSIKPESLNKTIVWSLNFDRASSEIAGLTIETGLLGVLVFEFASILFLLYAVFFLFRKSTHPGWNYAFGFFTIVLTLYITHFFYFFNTTFYFIYWLGIGLFMAASHLSSGSDEERGFSLAQSPRSTLSWMFLSLLVLAVLLVGTFFQAAIYGGEVAYSAAISKLNQPNPDYAAVSGNLGQAINLDSYRDTYLLGYGQNLIFQASQEAAKDKPDVKQITTWMSNLIAAGQRATQISPAKASNWSALAQFYTGIRTLVSGTDPHIIDSWQKAIDRDPQNPSLYIQLAQAYSNSSQSISSTILGTGADSDNDGLSDTQEATFGCDPHNSDTNANGVNDGDEVKAGFNCVGTGRLDPAVLAKYTTVDQAVLNKAQDALNTAIKLKPDLPDSYIALARILEQSSKLDDAKKELDDAAKQFPTNADILFEQGRVTFNQHNYADAEKIFKNVIALVPNHANAHYSLGLVYQQKGDNVDALAEFQKAEQIAGPNVDLEKIINQLKATTPTK